MKLIYPAGYFSKGSTSTSSKILSESHGAKTSLFWGGTGIHQNQKKGGGGGGPIGGAGWQDPKKRVEAENGDWCLST